MNIDKYFDNAIATVDAIAGRTAIDPWLDFNVDMTESQVLTVDDNDKLIMRPAMSKASGQHESERLLWKVGKPTKQTIKHAIEDERQRRLAEHVAAYTANPEYEIEVDTMTFATGIAKAFREYTGEAPTFLLGEDGEF